MRSPCRFSRCASAILSGVLLLACGQNSDNSTQVNHIADVQMLANVEAWEAAGADGNHQVVTETESNADYYAPSNYLKYPDEVRSLIRRADIENGHCRGNSGNNPETLRACNRRERIMAELEKTGWCWGGSQVGYLQHWLKCADDPYYRPGGHGPKFLYSDEEINELTQSHEQ